MFITYLLLGSNLGNSLKYLSDATLLIGHRVGEVIASSSVYCTAAWGKHDQPDFKNQVISVSTQLSASELLNEVLLIEKELGRERGERWGSRTIDIDILLYGTEIIDEPDLKIPHPFLHERRFCLEPLCEINAELFHPVYRKSLSKLLSELTDNLSVKKLP